MVVSGCKQVCEQCGYDDCPWYQDSHPEELVIVCPRCGWSLRSVPRIDRAHLRRTGERRHLRTRKGKVICQTIRRPGYGIYRIGHPGGGGVSGSISRAIDDAVVEYFRDMFAEDDVDTARSYLARWDPEAQAVVDVVGAYHGPCREGAALAPAGSAGDVPERDGRVGDGADDEGPSVDLEREINGVFGLGKSDG